MFVRPALKIVNPEGVETRSRGRLMRRKYKTKGPNYLWHIDGYDKLKPFGFCIHGAIDGYSRRVLWLEVGPSNNDPSIVAKYYLDCVKQLGGTARIHTRRPRDREWEYCSCTAVLSTRLSRRFLRGEKVLRYGTSTANQRYEAWLGILRKECLV